MTDAPDMEPAALNAALKEYDNSLECESKLGATARIIRAYLAARSAPEAGKAVDETLQARVQPWMMACFGEEISNDKVERGDRLLEEVFELLQSGGYDPARVLALRNYVWGRPAGEPFQEAGGVQITMAAYCLAHDLNMHEAGEAELARIWTKVDKIRAKQAAKPVGSALPVALASSPAPTGAEPVAWRRCNADEPGQWFDVTLDAETAHVWRTIRTNQMVEALYAKPQTVAPTGEIEP